MNIFSGTPMLCAMAKNTLGKYIFVFVIFVFMFYGFFIPVFVGNFHGCHDDQRIAQAIAFLFLFRMKIRVNGTLGSLPLSFISLILFFGFGIFSAFLSFSTVNALYEVSNFFLIAVFAYFISAEIEVNYLYIIKILLRCCGVGAACYAAFFLMIYCFALQSGVQPPIQEFNPGFTNIRFLSHAITVLLPFLLALVLLDNERKNLSLLWKTVLIFWWTILFVNSGRGVMFGFFVGGAVALLVMRKKSLPYLKLAVITALAGLVTYLIFFYLVPINLGYEPFGMFDDTIHRSTTSPMSGRVLLWKRAGELIMAHPWLGVGPLHFAHDEIARTENAHPHNWILQIWVEWGIFALIAACAAITLAYRTLLSKALLVDSNDLPNQNLAVVWIATGAAILSDGLVSGLMVMPVSQMLIALYLGCVIGWCRSFSILSPPDSAPQVRFAGYALHLMIATAIILFWAALWPGIHSFIDHSPVHQSEYNLHSPRMWEDGYF